jgi:lipoprotein NlpD
LDDTVVSPAPQAAASVPLLTEPKAIKQPYSEQAMIAAPAPTPTAAPEATPPAASSANGIDWGWPATGKIVTSYIESTSANKGIDIAGTLGQPVLAAAAGKVVYSGSGLRGYGNLVIIKHDDTYLSAYAHNSKLLVKEGQSIVKGQKIAEMGSSDAPRVQLHFEIRKFGKPVDPSKYLPANPS